MQTIQDVLKDRILILDGAMGTMIQKFSLSEEDFRGTVFGDVAKELNGNNECLNLTRPDVILDIHKAYIEAGADIIETNTFSANRISQSGYRCEGFAREMALQGAIIAKKAADEANRKVWVAGSVGPTGKSLSLASDISRPEYRQYGFDELEAAFSEQILALADGGADIILSETNFDALNVKAVIAARNNVAPGLPLMISVSVSDRSGRTLTGQTLEAFYTSVRHAAPLSFGLNCSFGAAQMKALAGDLSGTIGCALSFYPNAGLPDEMGNYTQTPDEMASIIGQMASENMLNIVGGCCGTTPEHIKAIASAIKGQKPRIIPHTEPEPSHLEVCGLEKVVIDRKQNNFTNIGERTNVAGSRKFARLIEAGNYDEALLIAAKQISDGATVIDINMDDAMLDSTVQMRDFLRYVSNDPAVAKSAVMIDSSDFRTILEGLKNAQGKCIVNSISLKEGEKVFLEKARQIRNFGAAMVVMAFDENGQATDYKSKIRICERAYRLLTQEAAVPPGDIIFDVNVLSIGTGIAEHARYGVDFIEAVRWIKSNLPGSLTSGGISNLSFAFRGNNVVREAMHSAFLYHATAAGLDMGIVNPSMLQIYDDINPELLKCVEDVIFDRDAAATSRLVDIATELSAGRDSCRDSMHFRQHLPPDLSLSEVHTVTAEANGTVVTAEANGTVVPAEANGTVVSAEANGTVVSAEANGTVVSAEANGTVASVEERLVTALVKGNAAGLKADIAEALDKYGTAVNVIQGPLMQGMDKVGKLFSEGRMFLPQVVKSAKTMQDAVELLQPYMNITDSGSSNKPVFVIATVKGDVHDIGKNITATVLGCNGFEVRDLGVMVPEETILEEAARYGAAVIGVSGLITPSLSRMEDLCRKMAQNGMTTPLFVGGATASAIHTAVKLSPLYPHVYYGSDASATAVMAKRYMMDPEEFEKVEHAGEEKLRKIYLSGKRASENTVSVKPHFETESYLTGQVFADIPVQEMKPSSILPHFDWNTFFAIWGVREDSDLRKEAEMMMEHLCAGHLLSIRAGVRFLDCKAAGNDIMSEEVTFPMLRQQDGKGLSLADFIVPATDGRTSQLGLFAISVCCKEDGCICHECKSTYGSMMQRTILLTLAEAASEHLQSILEDKALKSGKQGYRIIRPAAGYPCCPDHSIKRDILNHIPDSSLLEINLTDSCAMLPEASICGLIIAHKYASYPEIRQLSSDAITEYASKRGFSEEEARLFLGHLSKTEQTGENR